MKKYDLKKMLKGRKGGIVKIPIVPESLAFRRAYLAEMRRLIREIAKVTREEIIPSYRSELLTTDARESNFEALRRIVKGLLGLTNESVKRYIELESVKHTDKFISAAFDAFKIDLRSVVEAEDLQGYVEKAALRNAGLVTGMTDDLIKKIQVMTTNSLLNGETPEKLREKLKTEFKISDSRAQLIATDQTAKLSGELNKIRHMQGSVREYIWLTSQDERVRELHQDLDGERYKYNEPTGAEDGLEPGQPIRCRCVAQAFIDFGDDREGGRVTSQNDGFEHMSEIVKDIYDLPGSFTDKRKNLND